MYLYILNQCADYKLSLYIHTTFNSNYDFLIIQCTIVERTSQLKWYIHILTILYTPNAEMTFPRQARDLLMFPPSLSLRPSAPVALTRSLQR